MEKIKQNWKLFELKDICDNISHGNSIKEDDRIKGNLPYVSATAKNNGVSDFISNTNNSINSNVISVNSNGSVGYSFYHPYSALFSEDCVTVSLKNNKNGFISLFITIQIMQQKDSYSYNYKLSQERLMNLPIMLPIDDEENIDYEFMEEFIRDLLKSKLLIYKNFLENKINNLNFKEVPSLENKEWGVFLIKDIFDIGNGVRLTQENMKKGKVPFISSSSLNNGVKNFISNKNGSLDSNVLGVNYNGSVGESFYHPYFCLFSDDVKRFHLKNFEDNKYVFLFFKNIISQQKSIYDYNFKFNEKRMNLQKIKVPIDENNNPDYEYMKQFMINLELKLLLEYKKYLSKKLDTLKGTY